MQKFEKDLTYSYPTGVVPMGNDATLDISNPTPTYTPVTRGSALSGIRSRVDITPQSNASLGNVAQLDPIMRQRSVLEGQLETINAQINELINLMNSTQDTKSTQKGIYDDLKAKIERSDRLNNISAFKMSDSQRAIAVQNMRTAWNAYQTASASLITYQSQLDSLIVKRDALVYQLKTLGVPPSRFKGLTSRKDIINKMESRANMGVANKVVEDVATNVTDALQNLPGIGGVVGGGGGGGAMGGGEDQTQGASKSFFDENKIPIFVLGGSLAFLILNK
jgi:hypothetical protein